MMKLRVGENAPDFKLPDQEGDIHSLSDYKGKWLLVYFYPKDNTPGCTIEAQVIAEEFSNFKRLDVGVLGVSADSISRHKGFSDKHSLPFPILADEDKEMIKAYGVWQKKKLAGREYMGIVRWSFLINPRGKIVKVYEEVKPAEHAKEVLADLKELQ